MKSEIVGVKWCILLRMKAEILDSKWCSLLQLKTGALTDIKLPSLWGDDEADMRSVGYKDFWLTKEGKKDHRRWKRGCWWGFGGGNMNGCQNCEGRGSKGGNVRGKWNDSSQTVMPGDCEGWHSCFHVLAHIFLVQRYYVMYFLFTRFYLVLFLDCLVRNRISCAYFTQSHGMFQVKGRDERKYPSGQKSNTFS